LKLFQSVKGKKEEQEPVLSRRHTSARLVVQNPHNGWWRGRGTMGISKLMNELLKICCCQVHTQDTWNLQHTYHVSDLLVRPSSPKDWDCSA
jgi:hypothetical protein